MGRGAGIVLTVFVLALLSAAPASAQSGCGGLLQPPCPAPTPAPTPTPTPAPAPAPSPAPAPEPEPPLSAARFAGMERILSAGAAIEKGSATTAEFRTYRRRCAALSTKDPVLRTYRSACLVFSDYLDYDGFARCRGRLACARGADRAASFEARTAAGIKKANAAAAKAIEDKRCRAAVQTAKKNVRAFELGASSLRQFASALRSGSQKRVDAAVARVKRVDRLPLRSDTQQLKALRADCR